jgi:hypothetical protein
MKTARILSKLVSTSERINRTKKGNKKRARLWILPTKSFFNLKIAGRKIEFQRQKASEG